MDFDFSKEELLLKNSVWEYVRDKVVPMAESMDHEGPLSHEKMHDQLEQLVPFGHIGPLVPASRKGPGLTHVEAGIIYQELARGWAALGAMALSTSNMISAVIQSKNDTVARRLLPGLLSGKTVGAVCVTEPGAGSDAGALLTSAERINGHYILSGEKTWVANGAVADVLLVAVKTPPASNEASGFAYLLVEKTGGSFLVEETPKMGLRGLSTARIVFDRCRVPQDNFITVPSGADMPVSFLGASESCLFAAMAVGIMTASLDRSISYARQRRQFGKPLGAFQMIQKMLAEMAVDLDAATLLCYRALRKMDAGKPAGKESAMATSFAAMAAVDVASKAIQIHGAYGYSDEFPLERFYRDACCLGVIDGNPDMAYLRVANALTGLNALS